MYFAFVRDFDRSIEKMHDYDQKHRRHVKEGIVTMIPPQPKLSTTSFFLLSFCVVILLGKVQMQSKS